jgi:hypothetical protein
LKVNPATTPPATMTKRPTVVRFRSRFVITLLAYSELMRQSRKEL